MVMYGCESWTVKKAECQRIDAFKLWCWRRFLRVPWTTRRSKQSILKESALAFLWKEWCYSWNSSTLATSCKVLTHRKRLWCWEGLGAGGEGGDRRWDGWMASPTQWTWVWVNSGSWWWTGRPGVLWFIGSQRVGHDWVTDLNWTDWRIFNLIVQLSQEKEEIAFLTSGLTCLLPILISRTSSPVSDYYSQHRGYRLLKLSI